jgi:hypothetical protein
MRLKWTVVKVFCEIAECLFLWYAGKRELLILWRLIAYLNSFFPVKRREYSNFTVTGNVDVVTHSTSRYVIFSCSLCMKVRTWYCNNYTFWGRIRSGFKQWCPQFVKVGISALLVIEVVVVSSCSHAIIGAVWPGHRSFFRVYLCTVEERLSLGYDWFWTHVRVEVLRVSLCQSTRVHIPEDNIFRFCNSSRAFEYYIVYEVYKYMNW